MPNTMLGTAASSSMQVAIGPRSHSGQVSVRNTAMPNASGTAINIAISEVIDGAI